MSVRLLPIVDVFEEGVVLAYRVRRLVNGQKQAGQQDETLLFAAAVFRIDELDGLTDRIDAGSVVLREIGTAVARVGVALNGGTAVEFLDQSTHPVQVHRGTARGQIGPVHYVVGEKQVIGDNRGGVSPKGIPHHPGSGKQVDKDIDLRYPR